DVNGDSYGLSATVLADGSWQVTAPSLPDGSYTVTASITDAAGNTGSDTGTGSVDTLDPLISINNLGAINDDTPTLSGTSSEPQGTVISLTVTDSGGIITTLSATVDANGEWAVTSPVLGDDDYTVVASVSDAAGNSNSATDTFTLNTLAPSITINAIGETNDTTPTINGSSDAPDGSVVTVVINDGINPAETVQTTVTGGTWSVTASSDLAEGDFSVTATVEDGVGNQGTASINGIIDTTMPDISINPPADSNDTTPTISGTASAPQGSIVTLVFNDAAGNSHTVTTQMTPSGTWSVPALDALAEGTYTVTASVSDQAGNPASASVTGLIDVTTPVISVNALADSSDVTPLISGQSSGVPAGTQVSVTIIAANGAVQSATATTDGAGNWSVEASNAIIEGEYTVNVSVTDSAGNTGTDSETGVIDTTAPSVTIDAPALTNDNTPVVTGTSDLASSDIAITFT
ncbi:Ig-like domain-containing protein, partial [Pseudoalteromonas sp. SR41-6]